MSDINTSEAFQNSAILYLAGEMPLAERAAFSQRLTTDAAAASAFSQIESAWIGAHDAIELADRADTHATSADAGARWFGRRVAQWHVDRHAPAKMAPAAKSGKSMPLWTWPLAAAAVVVLGLGVWTIMPDNPGTPLTPNGGLVDSPVAFQSNREEQMADLAHMVDPALGMVDLENQAVTLKHLGDDAAAPGGGGQ